MSVPTVGNIADLGKPIFDSGSSAPIYAGSPSTGVYVDEVWVEAVLDTTNVVRLLYEGGSGFLGNSFSTALGKINDVSNTPPSGSSTTYNPSGAIKTWRRSFFTVDNSGGNPDWWRVSTLQQVLIYSIPTGVSASNIIGIYVEYGTSTDVVSAFISDDSFISTKILGLPLSGNSDFSSAYINTRTDTDFSGTSKIAIVPFIPDDAFGESDYTLTEAGGVLWVSPTLDLTPAKVYLKIKV